MRRSLPVLNSSPDALDLVEIPIPCEVPWDSMVGDEQVRHCGQCKQNVYNVASFTRAEATRLLNARACLRIYRRPDNTVLTSDCRERLRAARKRGLLIFAGTLVIVLWAQICAQFVGLMGLKRLVGGRATMGEARPVPGQLVAPPAPPPVPVQGPVPLVDPRPIMGEAPMMGAPPPPPPKTRKHRTMGKPAPDLGADRGAVKGRIAVRGPAFD
jgi:hypothetical protein